LPTRPAPARTRVSRTAAAGIQNIRARDVAVLSCRCACAARASTARVASSRPKVTEVASRTHAAAAKLITVLAATKPVHGFNLSPDGRWSAVPCWAAAPIASTATRAHRNQVSTYWQRQLQVNHLTRAATLHFPTPTTAAADHKATCFAASTQDKTCAVGASSKTVVQSITIRIKNVRESDSSRCIFIEHGCHVQSFWRTITTHSVRINFYPHT
jgi:hypothetical protein